DHRQRLRRDERDQLERDDPEVEPQDAAEHAGHLGAAAVVAHEPGGRGTLPGRRVRVRSALAHRLRTVNRSGPTSSLRLRSSCWSTSPATSPIGSPNAILRKGLPSPLPSTGHARSARNTVRDPAGNPRRSPAPSVPRQPVSTPNGASPAHPAPTSAKSVAPKSKSSGNGQAR